MLAMACAALSAYQSIVLVPILLLYGYRWKPAWFASLTAPAVIAAWQLWERATSGALPATVLAGYMQTYGLQAFLHKVQNAVALTGHLGWLVFPALALAAFRLPTLHYLAVSAIALGAAFYDPNPLFWASIATGLVILLGCLARYRDFLASWLLIFFAASLILFFAGSARYLLPLSLPLAILVSQRLSARWLALGFAAQLTLGLLLAIVNYQHWDGYRQFARSLRPLAETSRVWINGEWGLRFYLESEGALPLLQGQALHPGETVVTSALAFPLKPLTGGGTLAPIAEKTISSAIPLRLVALNGRSAYSTTLFGLRPFDISTQPIDRLQAARLVEAKPTLESLRLGSPESSPQIVSGLYDIENGQWRWMGPQATLLLKAPSNPAAISISLYIPDQAPARRIAIAVNGQPVLEKTLPGPGVYTLTTPVIAPTRPAASVSIAVDKTFSVPGDPRKLGIILTAAGFAHP